MSPIPTWRGPLLVVSTIPAAPLHPTTRIATPYDAESDLVRPFVRGFREWLSASHKVVHVADLEDRLGHPAVVRDYFFGAAAERLK